MVSETDWATCQITFYLYIYMNDYQSFAVFWFSLQNARDS